MCNTSVIIPIGTSGLPGLPGVGTNGLPGIQENVIFDTSLNISYSGQDFINSIPLDNNGNPDYTAWRAISYFIFPGTDNIGNIIPNKCYIVGNVSSNTWLVRIRTSNGIVVAESTGIIGMIPGTLIDLGVVSSLTNYLDIYSLEVYILNSSDVTSVIQINSLLLDQG